MRRPQIKRSLIQAIYNIHVDVEIVHLGWTGAARNFFYPQRNYNNFRDKIIMDPPPKKRRVNDKQGKHHNAVLACSQQSSKSSRLIEVFF